MKEGILKGIRVLDFSRVLAGPYATRILADAGAEVIKVQSRKTARGAAANLDGYFNTWNRNKMGITLDMSFPEAREITLRLVAVSDIVVENYSPRVMGNWGLDYAKLKQSRVDLIMLSMSGMGQTGPWKDFPAYAPAIQSLSGFTALTAESKDVPFGPGYAYADTVAGLYGALALLAALEYRDRTGEGQYIDLSELEAMCTAVGPALLEASIHHREILPQGNRPVGRPAAPHGCYRCTGEDRWCVIAVFNEAEWKALCKATGRKDWAENPSYATLSQRMAHTRELDEGLEQWTLQQTADQVVRRLQAEGVPASMVQDAEDLAHDPQLQAREFFVRLDHPVLGKTVSDGSPLRFAGPPYETWKSAPLLGADNRYVFLELLGMTEEELAVYQERGIIA